ncbi:hypothetical protein [Dokdonella sp.]|uniref:hypothetical protein n=1 Tax=Dokdonella sp. TaxID=2291710 RepID=UPI001B204F97|nr:hypothetical protein [Dokdonella sp.]MBO9663904.1 hypothetical protein [Dokdonella sp.]
MPNNRILAAVIAGAISLTSSCFAADDVPDPDFGTQGFAYLSIDGVEGHELRTSAVIVLPDGKLLFGGSRNRLIEGNPDPHMRGLLARMNADGSVDTGFGSDPNNPGLVVLPDMAPGTQQQQVETLLRLADGSIFVAGSADAFAPLTGFALKLTAQGEPAKGFTPVSMARTRLHASAVDSQGRILLVGDRPSAGLSEAIVVRLTGDGAFDTTFGDDANGIVRLAGSAAQGSSYLSSVTVVEGDRILVGGAFESQGEGLGTDFSLARLDADGRLDATFAGDGWRRFRMPDDASLVNGVDYILPTPDGKFVLAGHREDAATGVYPLLLRVDADGATDATFGDEQTPGYQPLVVAPAAWNRYPAGIVRLGDGKLLVGITYAGPGKQDFIALRTSADGQPDAEFGEQGQVQFDLAPEGIYSNLTAVALQDGRPILAGSVKRSLSSGLVDLAAVRLGDGGAIDDTIFANGFEGAPTEALTNYDDLEEGFKGTVFHHNGVTYREINNLGGVFPDGSTFDAEYVGDNVLIDDAKLLFKDFTSFGSSPNVLGFGRALIPGPNISLSPLVRATMDLDAPASAASFEAMFYENGPWGGIELHLDAYRGEELVASDSVTLSDLGGRDDLTTRTFSVAGATFDSLRFYATFDGQPSAPRVIVDNLRVMPAGAPAR